MLGEAWRLFLVGHDVIFKALLGFSSRQGGMA